MELRISEEFIGKRIDSTISECTNLSRSRVQRLIESGKVSIDLKIAHSNSSKIAKACIIDIKDYPLEDTEYEIVPEDLPLDILYEDEFVVVINKPAGIVCHPAPGHKSGTLVNALAYHFENSLSNIGGALRPGIVHRLDKDTSGAILIAKTNDAHSAFANLFANEKGKSIKRRYTCFVFGAPLDKSSRIETFIKRHPKNRQIFTVDKDGDRGKYAITLYSLIRSVYFSSTKAISELDCELLTGRTHQIRVHMKHIGHHIIGDQIYGKSKVEPTYPEIVRNFPRQALHSREIEFFHPFIKKFIRLEAPLPEDLRHLSHELFPPNNTL